MAETYPSSTVLNALSGTTVAPGVPAPTTGERPWYTAAFKWLWRVCRALIAPSALEVYKDDATSLTYGVRAGKVIDGNAVRTYAGGTGLATDDATNYLYLDAAGAVQKSTVAFPDGEATPHIPLAIIKAGSASGTGISGQFGFDDIEDCRPRSLLTYQHGQTAAEIAAAGAAGAEVYTHLGVTWGDWNMVGDASGGGIVAGSSEAEAAAAYCVAYDHGTTDFETLSNAAALTHYTANWQLQGDAADEAVDDAVYFGADGPFCELRVDLTGGVGQVATYGGDAGQWEYYNGATWADLTANVYDHTDTTAGDGKRPFQASGAVVFVPPDDWAAVAVNGQSAYWIRWRCTAAQITQPAITDSKEHFVVTPSDDSMRAPIAGTLTAIRAIDPAATVHADQIYWFLWNKTQGTATGLLTWPAAQRAELYTGLTLVCAADDELVAVAWENGAATFASNVLLEMTFER